MGLKDLVYIGKNRGGGGHDGVREPEDLECTRSQVRRRPRKCTRFGERHERGEDTRENSGYYVRSWKAPNLRYRERGAIDR